jgi:hypothetical protein
MVEWYKNVTVGGVSEDNWEAGARRWAMENKITVQLPGTGIPAAPSFEVFGLFPGFPPEIAAMMDVLF